MSSQGNVYCNEYMVADFPAAPATSWQSSNHIADVVQRFPM